MSLCTCNLQILHIVYTLRFLHIMVKLSCVLEDDCPSNSYFGVEVDTELKQKFQISRAHSWEK